LVQSSNAMPDGARRDPPPIPRLPPPGGRPTNLGSASNQAAAERRFFCPECRKAFTEREQAQHLIVAHGYLSLSGTLLPRPAALTCLWGRVFSTGDPQAHDQLCHLLAPRAGQTNERSPYVAALESELRGRIEALLSVRRGELSNLVHQLRRSTLAREQFWHLITAADPRSRELGRELLLPDAAAALAGPQASTIDVRRWLENLCPLDDVWAKIRVCRRLLQMGAARSPTKECLRQLQGARPVSCPECGAAVPQDQLEHHLRHRHRINQFRGIQGSLDETIAALLAAVCNPDPDPTAWESVETIAQEEEGAKAGSYLATQVAQTLAALPEEDQEQALRAVADLLAVSVTGPEITQALLTRRGRCARQLALALVARLAPPVSEVLIEAARPLLARKRAPRPAQVAAAAALLRTTGKDGPEAEKIINSLISRCGKARALDRLRRLEQFAGSSPTLEARCSQIERRIRMRCPRCKIQLRHPEMGTHLWSEHGLVLDGRRVREPWLLVRDWLESYQRTHDPELLVRCRSLGQHVDPEQGLQRVHRLVLAEGIEDLEARQILLARAKQRGESLCPHCYALVPVPEEVVPRALNESHGRLSLDGYSVEVSEAGLIPRLTIETPHAVVYRGREPGRWLTRQGAILLLAGPPVVVAFFLALFFNSLSEVTRWPAGLTILAVILYLIVQAQWWRRPRLIDRAVDYAWLMFVPRLHLQGFSVEDSAFLAGLALTSLRHGRPKERAENLKRLVNYTESALLKGSKPLSHFAALKRLEVADDVGAGKDPVPSVAGSVARCFANDRPLTFAQQLLGDWEGSWWTPGNLARLRVLLCDRAFEAGLEMLDLLEAGHSAPALAAVLKTDDSDGLAQLRLLWSLRPRRPWGQWGDPVTVFELANAPELGRKLLAKHPDLLLMDQGVPGLYVCAQGIVFQNVLFTSLPRKIEARARRDFARSNPEIVIGEHHFPTPSDAAALATRVERWFHYYFSDFRAQVAAVYSWQSPAGTTPIQFREPVRCQECRRSLVAVPGDVGLAVNARGDPSNPADHDPENKDRGNELKS